MICLEDATFAYFIAEYLDKLYKQLGWLRLRNLRKLGKMYGYYFPNYLFKIAEEREPHFDPRIMVNTEFHEYYVPGKEWEDLFVSLVR
jgi:hypothetical protein